MIQRALLVLLAVALLVAGGLAGAWVVGQTGQPASAQTTREGLTRTITVVGQGTARVEPDIAQVSIGAETMAPTVSDAVAQNQAQMDAILAALRAAGIPDKDIQTMNFSISYERYPEPVPVDSGSEPQAQKPQYRVSNMVTVTIRDLDKVGQVLDVVVEAGANSIWGVSFSVDDPKAAQSEARAKAMADAEARAKELARLGGLEVGSIVSISEVVSGNVVPTPVMYERAAAGSTSISPGEVEIGYQVQVVYEVEG